MVVHIFNPRTRETEVGSGLQNERLKDREQAMMITNYRNAAIS